MGYTHYWRQLRSFTKPEWDVVRQHVEAILADAEQRHEVRLCNGAGDRGSKPDITDDLIFFNGSGDDAHETFCLHRVVPAKESWQRVRGNAFCKTARKPYDLAVTAVLCYLSSVCETHRVSSDGHGRDFLAGLELAKQAIPPLGNTLDLPRGVLEDDRWCQPWPRLYTEAYSFNFCVDGHAYVTRTKTGETFRFHSHATAAEFAQAWQEKGNEGMRSASQDSLFNAFGSFDERRRRSIGRQQCEALGWLLARGAFLDQYGQLGPKPPAFVRPGELPAIETAYSFAEVLKLGKQPA